MRFKESTHGGSTPAKPERREDVPLHATDTGREAAFVQPRLGQSLRRLRKETGLSLADVASATGVSSSFLALVERGRSDIALGRLTRVMQAYGATLTDLQAWPEPDRLVVRRGQERHFRSGTGVDLYLLVQDTDREMMPVLTTFAPRSRLADLEPHDGETVIHVLEGTLLLELAGTAPIVLREGDTAYYNPRLAAPVLTNLGETPVRLVGAVTPPIL
jgi:transcriptional regulator with XRE-family HTH domain